jgi:prevent-host-death family protein
MSAMKQVDIRDAKANLSKLVDEAARGEPFVISKRDKPLVKVLALDTPTTRKTRRLGFMANQLKVPDDFDRMSSKAISRLFDTSG